MLEEFWSFGRDYHDWPSFVSRLGLAPGEWGIVCPYEVGGAGDTYFICALARLFLIYNGKFPLTVVVGKAHGDIPRLFRDGGIHRAVIVDKPCWHNLPGCPKASAIRSGYPILGHPFYFAPLDYLGYKDIHLLDMYRLILRIPPYIQLLTRPKVAEADVESAKQKFAALKLPQGNTAIIAPHANSTSTLPPAFWERLAERLLRKGWAVCTNVAQKEAGVLPGTVGLSFSLAEAIPMAELAGWVISARSGLSDIVHTARASQSVIYRWQPWYQGTVLTVTGLGRMGLSRHVLEYELKDDNWEKALDSIADRKVLG